MVPEQIDRMRLRWSREDLARLSGVGLASIILIERFGSSTEIDDAKIRDTLARGLAESATVPRIKDATPQPAHPTLDAPQPGNTPHADSEG